MDVDREIENRWRFLRHLYEVSEGNPLAWWQRAAMYNAIGLTAEEGERAFQYLLRKGLVEFSGPPNASITIAGVDEVEQALRAPQRGTENFSSSVIQHVYNAPVGSVQHGAGSTAHVTQNVGNLTADVRVLFQQLREQAEGNSEAIEAVDALEQEVAKPSPARGVLRAMLAGMGTLLADSAKPVLTELAKRLLGIGG